MTIQWREFEYCFDSVDFGIALRDYRQMAGMTQAQVADLLGFKSGHIITRLECGTYDQSLTLKDLIKICNWIDVSPSLFFTMQGSA